MGSRTNVQWNSNGLYSTKPWDANTGGNPSPSSNADTIGLFSPTGNFFPSTPGPRNPSSLTIGEPVGLSSSPTSPPLMSVNSVDDPSLTSSLSGLDSSGSSVLFPSSTVNPTVQPNSAGGPSTQSNPFSASGLTSPDSSIPESTLLPSFSTLLSSSTPSSSITSVLTSSPSVDISSIGSTFVTGLPGIPSGGMKKSNAGLIGGLVGGIGAALIAIIWGAIFIKRRIQKNGVLHGERPSLFHERAISGMDAAPLLYSSSGGLGSSGGGSSTGDPFADEHAWVSVFSNNPRSSYEESSSRVSVVEYYNQNRSMQTPSSRTPFLTSQHPLCQFSQPESQHRMLIPPPEMEALTECSESAVSSVLPAEAERPQWLSQPVEQPISDTTRRPHPTILIPDTPSPLTPLPLTTAFQTVDHSPLMESATSLSEVLGCATTVFQSSVGFNSDNLRAAQASHIPEYREVGVHDTVGRHASVETRSVSPNSSVATWGIHNSHSVPPPIPSANLQSASSGLESPHRILSVPTLTLSTRHGSDITMSPTGMTPVEIAHPGAHPDRSVITVQSPAIISSFDRSLATGGVDTPEQTEIPSQFSAPYLPHVVKSSRASLTTPSPVSPLSPVLPSNLRRLHRSPSLGNLHNPDDSDPVM